MRSATLLLIAFLFIGALATVPRRAVRRQPPHDDNGNHPEHPHDEGHPGKGKGKGPRPNGPPGPPHGDGNHPGPEGPPPNLEEVITWVCGNISDNCTKEGVSSQNDGTLLDLCDKDHCNQWLPEHLCFFQCAAKCGGEGQTKEETEPCLNECMTCEGGPNFNGDENGHPFGDENGNQGPEDQEGEADANVEAVAERITQIAAKHRLAIRRLAIRRFATRRAAIRRTTRRRSTRRQPPPHEDGNEGGHPEDGNHPGPKGPPRPPREDGNHPGPQGPPPTLEEIIKEVCSNITEGCTQAGDVSNNDGKVTDLCDIEHCNQWLPEHLCFFQCVADNCQGKEGEEGKACADECMTCEGGAPPHPEGEPETAERIIKIVAKSRSAERLAIRRLAIRRRSATNRKH